ncbi:Membrane-bound metal-dependent hydrolase YbcI, DUF457 family [Desulfacinum hydrothermale DSM 13146]|uniref:Membrane-bound metal-dependent hydrolase YbcI, DUF457 family n=1 Tax=Desulfacinum hydrothermale DSM 13146 TaxID=1121390 RepID=A0A1W1XWS5_9BACT|nr:HD domain-containing protein [Desulfacinum hydrothermale]SMC28322.1 Membrane-bound metal-dependent hydrolase YbcI, DUF457 family [Desulfacinum hydrothermale DSM 13146]
MRWRSHALIAASCLYATYHCPADIMLGTILSSLPDRVETPFGPNGLRLLRHRGRSHEVLVWMGVLFVCLVLHVWLMPTIPLEGLPDTLLFLFGGTEYAVPLYLPAFAGLLHLVGDVFTPGGIRLAGQKVTFGWCKTGTLWEVMVAVGVSLAVLGLRMLDSIWGGWVFAGGIPAVVVFLGMERKHLGFLRSVHRKKTVVGEEVYDIRRLMQNYSADVQVSERKSGEADILSEKTGKGLREFVPEDAEEDAEGSPEKSGIEVPGWTSESIAVFWRDMVEPYFDRWQQDSALRCVLSACIRVLSILDEEGDHPSVNLRHEEEGNKPKEVCLLLSRISLRRHSLNVARVSADLLRDRFGERWWLYYPLYLLVSLSHDLGKITVAGTAYSTGSHPVASAERLAEILSETRADEHMQSEVLTAAVRHHHDAYVPGHNPNVKGESENLYHSLLVLADRTARSREVEEAKRMDGFSADADAGVTESAPEDVTDTAAGAEAVLLPPAQMHERLNEKPVSSAVATGNEVCWPEEMSVGQIIDFLKDYINYRLPRRPEYWKSVSQPDGYIYFHMDLLNDALVEVASKACSGMNLYLWSSNDSSLRDKKLIAFYEQIRANKWSHPKIGNGYYSTRFSVLNHNTGKKYEFRLSPIHYTAFGIPLEQIEMQRQQDELLRYITVGRKE